jgi:SRSO17 transposase
MLRRAFEADVPASWVVADSFYGRSHDFRSWLEKRGRPYAMMVSKTNAVRYRGRTKKIERLVERLPEDAWALVASAGERPDGRCRWEWTCLELHGDPQKGRSRWLLARRSSEDPEDVAFYQLYGPEGTSATKLVDVCQKRWKVEDCFAEAKGEVGFGPLRGKAVGPLAPLRHAVPVGTRLPGGYPLGRPR